MPELPEVETVARQLAPLITGRKLARCELLDPKLSPVAAELAPLQGCVIERVYRQGKRVALSFTPKRGAAGAVLLVHLRMTGRLVWQAGQAAIDPKHLRADFALAGGHLLFYDPRRFGTLDVLPAGVQPPGEGLDPLAAEFTRPVLQELLSGARQPLKTWLLRQDKLVGLGNIYASEICHRARLSPERSAGGLNAAEVTRLYRAVRDVLTLAVKHCGTTFSDFQDAHGLPGNFRRLLRVYGRAGEPCKSCGAPIERCVQQQRSTFFCPQCQQ